MRARCTDQEFIALFKQLGSNTLVAKHLGTSDRVIQNRRRRIEDRYGIQLQSWNSQNPAYAPVSVSHHKARVNLRIENAVAICFSDCHFWPGITTTAHKACVKLHKLLKPDFSHLVGDAFDGARVSRWPRIGWDKTPTVKEELECVQERLTEVRDAHPSAERIWELGNHDARYETNLASIAPEYEGVPGFSLKDHFPEWRACWSSYVNDDTIIKHRWKGGEHGTYNNTKVISMNFIHGHAHKLKTTWYTTPRGTFYGVDCGMTAEPDEQQFMNYTEDNPKDWRSGFDVLTWYKGKLMQPEIVEVIEEGVVWFRGQRISV